ncbi:MAG: DUF2188 domain-containing protein, partial [Acidimicrobiales bacterium]|nr:DUF2188 domain-containing protein [Acidimicrobiales bacterium]
NSGPRQLPKSPPLTGTLPRDTARRERTEHSIHRKDGQIGERNSYGNDPHPPTG